MNMKYIILLFISCLSSFNLSLAQLTQPLNVAIFAQINQCDSLGPIDVPYKLFAVPDSVQGEFESSIIEIANGDFVYDTGIGNENFSTNLLFDIPIEIDPFSLRLETQFLNSNGDYQLVTGRDSIISLDPLEIIFFLDADLCSQEAPNCRLDFDAFPTSQNALTFQFMSYLNGDTLAPGDTNIFQLWDFGDGTQSNEPFHTYETSGFYTVSLEVDNFAGCKVSSQRTIQVGDSSFNDAPKLDSCTVSFNAFSDPGELSINFIPIFEGNRILQFDSTITQIWDFGDGTTGNKPTHTYKEFGRYEVCLKVITETCEAVFCRTINVRGNLACDLAVDIDWEALGNNTYDFSLVSTANPDSPVFDVSQIITTWIFEDDTITDSLNTIYTFPYPRAVYEVQAIAVDPVTGCDAFLIANIPGQDSVSCGASFDYSILENGLYEFRAISSNDYLDSTNIIWQFRDGTVKSGQTILYNPNTNQDFQVCLSISTVDLCTAEICEIIPFEEVELESNGCEAAFEFEIDGLAVSFFQTSNNNTLGIAPSWELGDGSLKTGTSVFHTYESPGTYQVCMKQFETENSGCFLCKTVEILPDSAIEDTIENDPGIEDTTEVGIINGIIDMDSADIELMELYVVLLDEDSVEIGRAPIQADGSYNFDNIPSGNYIIRLISGLTNELMDEQAVEVDPTQQKGATINFFNLIDAESSVVDKIFRFNVYPNPVQDIVNIEVGADQAYSARIIVRDMLGKELISRRWELTKGIQAYELTLNQLPKGMYHIVVESALFMNHKSIQIQ